MMKKVLSWVIAATLVCGTAVFTACSDDDNTSSAEQAAKNRETFVAHSRAMLKDLAQNLKFKSWPKMNSFLLYFNEAVLLNKDYNTQMAKIFEQKITESTKPVEAGSDLAALGYTEQATIDLSNFNYLVTVSDATTFKIEESQDFRFKIYNPKTKVNIDILFEGTGTTIPVLSKSLSTETLAVIVLVPQQFKFVLSNDSDGNMRPWLTGTYNNTLELSTGSSYVDITKDKWTLTGNTVTGHGGQVTDFTIIQDPVTHKAYNKFSFVLNGRKMIDISSESSNTTGQKTIEKLTPTSSALDLLVALLDGNNIDAATITLLDDLTTTMSISDMKKLLQLEEEYRTAGRSSADQPTIDKYTQQLNELVTAKMTCKGVNQTIPMRLVTTQVGIDYWTLYGFKFEGSDEYVSLKDLLDQESVEYFINIVDHSTGPMEQGILVVRQLFLYLQSFANGFKQ